MSIPGDWNVVDVPLSTEIEVLVVQGRDGAGVQLAGAVSTYAELPDDLTGEDAGKAYVVQENGKLYVWSGTAWPLEPQGADFRGEQGPQGVQGATGPSGPANSLSIGVVTAGPAGASITGSAPSQVLNLTLPEGPAGEQGPQGERGEVGPASTVPGPDGKSITAGTGAPVSAAPYGTLYIDVSTGDLYRWT